jgi:hypothetical protein
MRAEKLLDEIGLIDNGIIQEADSYTKIKSAKYSWLKWGGAIAACAAVAAIAMFVPQQAENYPELPSLTIGKDTGTYGFEGYMAYDIEDLGNGNPWVENSNIKTLPVFQNPTVYDENGKPIAGLSADKMTAMAKETADLMGLTIESITIFPTAEDLKREQDKGEQADATPQKAAAICGAVTIEVAPGGEITIRYEDSGVALPGEYNFTQYDETERQAENVMQYLISEYNAVVGMESPSPALFGDYTYDGQRIFRYSAFECAGTLEEKILGYNFNRIGFYPNEEGKLWIIRRYKADLSQKIGDYPIISAAEARQLLLEKSYITTVPEELPDEKYISRVELIYRTGIGDEVFMPYYRFYVEMPTMARDNGLKTFGAFYVPAVKAEFINNFPLWDGGFN